MTRYGIMSRLAIGMVVACASVSSVSAQRADALPDYLANISGNTPSSPSDVATRDLVTLRADRPLAEIREWLAAGAGGATHQGFPVLDDDGQLVGVVTRRNLLDPTMPDERTVRDVIERPPVVVFEDNTLRDAADQMVIEHVGRVAVVERGSVRTLVGIITRSDLLAAHAPRLDAAHRTHRARALRLGA